MCSGAWPFRKQIPEAIIWQVGKGVKPSLSNVDVPREVKVRNFMGLNILDRAPLKKREICAYFLVFIEKKPQTVR